MKAMTEEKKPSKRQLSRAARRACIIAGGIPVGPSPVGIGRVFGAYAQSIYEKWANSDAGRRALRGAS